MESVEVTVFYLEMLAPSHRPRTGPTGGLTVLHIPSADRCRITARCTTPWARITTGLRRKTLSDEHSPPSSATPEMKCTSCMSRARPPASPSWTAAEGRSSWSSSA